MFIFGEEILATKVHPISALKIFMFFFVGGLVGLGYDLIGGSASLVPLVIGLAGLGAVACVGIFVRPSQQEVRPTNGAPLSSKRMEGSSAERPENCD
jgi:hypothetical protein